MRRAIVFALVSLTMQAAIVDGVAVTVGNKAIAASEIDRRIRLTAFQNGEKPDFSLASRRQAAQRLIDQRLVEREMDLGRYPRTTPEMGDRLLADYEKTNYQSNAVAMDAALKGSGLMRRDLLDELILQAELLTFLNLRFRPAVEVTAEDVQKYFNEQVLRGPEKTKQAAQAGALDEMRAAIELQLTAERANRELDAWLQDQRKRTKIEYIEKDLEESGK